MGLSEEAEYAFMASKNAFEMAGIDDQYLLDNEVGVIFGNDSSAKAVVEAIRAGKLVVLHEKVGMSVLNTDGVERTCMEVPKPETPDA
jgi:hypothetical protein